MRPNCATRQWLISYELIRQYAGLHAPLRIGRYRSPTNHRNVTESSSMTPAILAGIPVSLRMSACSISSAFHFVVPAFGQMGTLRRFPTSFPLSSRKYTVYLPYHIDRKSVVMGK